MRRLWWLALVLVVAVGCAQTSTKQAAHSEAGKAVCPEAKGLVSTTTEAFHSSLHHTTRGMGYWYSKEQGGFETFTGIPYSQKMMCYHCHAKSCETCHGKKTADGKVVYSLEPVYKLDTCLGCHARAKAIMKFDKMRHQLDVHIKAGMVCADCHTSEEIHGDGTCEAKTMMEAVKVRCQHCHIDKANQPLKLANGKVLEIPAFENDIAEHQMHKDNIACVTCHINDQISCLNCHFDKVMQTRAKIPGKTFFPTKQFALLLNYRGKVYPGTFMTLVYKDKTFVAVAPYFSHSVQSTGKTCDSCHGNESVIKSMDEVYIQKYENGRFVFPAKGFIPLVKKEDGSFNFKFEFGRVEGGKVVRSGKKVDLVGGKWVLLKDKIDKIQIVENAKPLTKEQLEALKEAQ